jgi:hypothetical protein
MAGVATAQDGGPEAVNEFLGLDGRASQFGTTGPHLLCADVKVPAVGVNDHNGGERPGGRAVPQRAHGFAGLRLEDQPVRLLPASGGASGTGSAAGRSR